MKNDREFTGTLLGFDDFVSAYSLFVVMRREWSFEPLSVSRLDMVLEDVTELCVPFVPPALSICESYSPVAPAH